MDKNHRRCCWMRNFFSRRQGHQRCLDADGVTDCKGEQPDARCSARRCHAICEERLCEGTDAGTVHEPSALPPSWRRSDTAVDKMASLNLLNPRKNLLQTKYAQFTSCIAGVRGRPRQIHGSSQRSQPLLYTRCLEPCTSTCTSAVNT